MHLNLQNKTEIVSPPGRSIDWSNYEQIKDYVPMTFKLYLEMINEYLISKAEVIGDPLLLQKLKEREENEQIIQELIEENDESEIQSKYEKTVSENSMIGMKVLPDQTDNQNLINSLQAYMSKIENPYEDEKYPEKSKNSLS